MISSSWAIHFCQIISLLCFDNWFLFHPNYRYSSCFFSSRCRVIQFIVQCKLFDAVHSMRMALEFEYFESMFPIGIWAVDIERISDFLWPVAQLMAFDFRIFYSGHLSCSLIMPFDAEESFKIFMTQSKNRIQFHMNYCSLNSLE